MPAQADVTPDPYWGPEQVSEFYGVPVGTLYQWRQKGTGPKAVRIGKHLRYRRSDVLAWPAEDDKQNDPRPAA